MKKKYFFGIVAMLMVIALALTGCRQQDGQNAGATGSESQNVDNDSAGEAVAETENEGESPSANASSNKSTTQDADGNYIYTITVDDVQTEVKTCINVWDYITDDSPYDRVDFMGMAEDLGWRRIGAATDSLGLLYNREDGILAAIAGTYDSDDYNLPTGERRMSGLDTAVTLDGNPVMFDAGDKMMSCADDVNSKSIISGEPFLVEGMGLYVSFDQIVVFAAFADCYRYNQVPLFRYSDHVYVNVP
ncbi:MAG: hypothetical protein ACI3W5_08625 [Faecousia sp.]